MNSMVSLRGCFRILAIALGVLIALAWTQGYLTPTEVACLAC